jgi:hypothetical protein
MTETKYLLTREEVALPQAKTIRLGFRLWGTLDKIRADVLTTTGVKMSDPGLVGYLIKTYAAEHLEPID